MRRLYMFMIAFAVMLGWTSAAYASSHGKMPAGLSFLQMVNWELVHFNMHINFVYAAVVTYATSPHQAWALLSIQSICANASPVTSFLFGSPGMSLLTFFVIVGAAFGLFCFALHRAIKMLARQRWPMIRRFAIA